MTSIHQHNIEEYKTVYKTDLAAKSYEVRVKVDVLIRLIPSLKNNEKFLEIGYGTGDLLHKLSRKYNNAHFTGMEVVKEAGLLYKKRFPNDKNVKLILGDAEKKLPPYKNEYDVIVLSHVIEHLKDEDKFLKNVLKILKKEGLIIFAVPEWGQSDLHYRQYNKNNLKKIAKVYHLKLILLKGDGFYINKSFYKLLSLVKITKEKKHLEENVSKKQTSESLLRPILIKIYHNFIVNILLMLNRLDDILCATIDGHPIQWIAIYQKNK